jgi:flagellar biosynthesis component FlhA
MKTNTLPEILKLSSIILFILNVLFFAYCIILMIDNNLVNILLFLTFIIISIVNIHIVKNNSEFFRRIWGEYFDAMNQEFINLNSMLKNGAINKAEARNRKEEKQKTCDYYGKCIGLSEISLKISIIIFILPIILIFLKLLFGNINTLYINNYIIYAIVFGIISQTLILVFSKILYFIF